MITRCRNRNDRCCLKNRNLSGCSREDERNKGKMKPPRVPWILRVYYRRVTAFVRSKIQIIRITFFSLCFNQHLDIYYAGDTLMEPMFWCVDHFAKCFGPLFVTVVCLLILSVVIVAHLIGIPYWLHRNPVALVGLIIFGYWLLVNVVFHYVMAAITSPGYVPEGGLVPEAVSICKKCIAPKPPRTHHCSVCRLCILKMDHHCPWLNNCIGHFNHRFFFMFCIYMLLGVMFIIIFGFDIIWRHFCDNPDSEIMVSDSGSSNATNHIVETELVVSEVDISKMNSTKVGNYDPALPWKDEPWYHAVLTCVALLLCGVLVALGALTSWHASLISRGETSIEAHINKAETIRLKKEGKVYTNPYDFKSRENWMLFLGLKDGRSWRHLLLPSTHLPEGEGLRWRTATFSHREPC